MKYLNNRFLSFSILLITAVIFILSVFILNSSLKNMKINIWNGYYILMVESGAPVEEISRDIESNGNLNVIDAFNTEVDIFSYSGNNRLKVSDISRYYLDEDPLYDDFLKKLPLLFHGEYGSDKYNIIYISTELKTGKFLKIINSVMQDYNSVWYVPDIKEGRSVLNLIIFSIFVAVLMYRNKTRIIILLPGIFPWTLYTMNADFAGLVSSLIFLFAWILLIPPVYRSYRHFLNFGSFEVIKPGKVLTSLLILLFSFIYLGVIDNRSGKFLPYLLAVTAHISSFIFFLIILFFKQKRQQHRLFFPVNINETIPFRPGSDLVVSLIFVSVIVVLPFLYGDLTQNTKYKLPVPVKIEGISDFSQVSMEVLNKHSGRSELPDLSDYVSHMSFLETYPYGFSYKFPSQDEDFSVSTYSLDNGELFEKNVQLNIFTDEWYESIMDNGVNTGIVTLLLSQGVPTLVKYQAGSGSMVTEGYLRKHYLFSLFLILALILWFSNISPSGFFSLKQNVIRRKQQVV